MNPSINKLSITSTANKRIKSVLKLRTHRYRRKTGLFIAEGIREIIRAVQAELQILEVYYNTQLLQHHGDYPIENLIAQTNAVQIETSTNVFKKLAYLREPEGIIAVVKQPQWSWDELPVAVHDNELFLVTVGTEKPGNLGAMIRTADAAGCRAVLAAGPAVDTFNPNTIRASTCAVYTMPTISDSDQTIMDYLLTRHIHLYAATVQNAIPYDEIDYHFPAAIVIGPEDTGLPQHWLDTAGSSGGSLVTIPMKGRITDSLNASNAAAVLLFEVLKNKRMA